MSLGGCTNVSETISSIALDLRSINDSNKTKQARWKRCQRCGYMSLLFIAAFFCYFSIFNVMYANFNLLSMINDNFIPLEQSGIYIAAVALTMVEFLVLASPIACLDRLPFKEGLKTTIAIVIVLLMMLLLLASLTFNIYLLVYYSRYGIRKQWMDRVYHFLAYTGCSLLCTFILSINYLRTGEMPQKYLMRAIRSRKEQIEEEKAKYEEIK